MNAQVTTRQTCLILIIVAITAKLLFLPSLLVQEVGRDAYLFVLLTMLAKISILFIFVYLTYKFPQDNFKQLLTRLFGKVFSRVVMFLYFAYFVIQTGVVFQSAYVYLFENLYSDLAWYIYVFPLVLTMVYVCIKGLRPIARLVEIFCPVIIVGVMLSFFLGGVNADFTNALPFMENNFFVNLGGVSKYALWFSDYLIYMVLFGNIKITKQYGKKILYTALFCAVLVSVCILIFYCLFDYSAIFHKNAITDVMQVVPRNSDIGSLDWVVTLIWDASMVIYMCIMFFASVKTCQSTFSIKKDWINILIVIVLLGAIVLVSKFDVARIIRDVSGMFRYFYYVVSWVIPIVMFIIALCKSKEAVREKLD